MSEYKRFSIFGKQLFFTHIFDNTCRYNFGGTRTFTDENGNTTTTNNASYWHKVCFGIYIKSDSWIR